MEIFKLAGAAEQFQNPLFAIASMTNAARDKADNVQEMIRRVGGVYDLGKRGKTFKWTDFLQTDAATGEAVPTGLGAETHAIDDDAKKKREAALKKQFGRQFKYLKELQDAGVVRMAHGGGVSGEDSIPAMLTPGEFVMSKSAVQRHGVGYMKNLNRGRIPGFRRGGLIAGGNVAYRANGGSSPHGSQYGPGGAPAGVALGLDPTRVQTALDEWHQKFSETINKSIGAMTSMTSELQSMANIFNAGLQLRHEFGDLTMNVNIANGPAIGDAVKAGIMKPLTDQITKVVNAAIKADREKPA